MEKSKTWRRWPVWIFLVVVILLLVAVIGLRFLLTSSWVAEQLTARLEKMYGGRVKVGHVEIGLSGESSIHDLELYEQDGKNPKPWLKVEKLTTDINARKFLGGEELPKQLTVADATLMLRWDDKGHLLTRLPKKKSEKSLLQKLPRVQLENSQLVFSKGGQRVAKIEGITGTLEDQGKQYILKGKVADPTWGKWSIHGTVAPEKDEVHLDVKSQGEVAFSTSKFRNLPFVPEKIWQELQVDGKSAVHVGLTYHMASEQLHYHVEVDPVATSIVIPDMALKANSIEGKIIIDDGLAKVRDIKGKTLGGIVEASGTVNFETPEVQIRFPNIKAENIPVENIPQHWNFPLKIAGNLNAQADISAVYKNEDFTLHGRVKGKITGKEKGGPQAEFTMKVNTSGNAVNWTQAGSDESEQNTQHTTDSENQDKEKSSTAETPANKNEKKAEIPDPPSEIHTSARGPSWNRFLRMSQVYLCSLQAPAKQPAQKANTIDLNLKMQNLDLQEYSKKLKLKLPYELKGKLSFQVKAAIPTKTFSDPKSYSATGTVKMENLQIADIHFSTVDALAKYENGILTLQHLKANLVTPQGKDAGNIFGTAQMGLFPLGQLTAKVSVKDIAAGQLATVLKNKPPVEGRLSGKVAAVVAVKKLREIKAWSASGDLSTDRLEAYGLTLQKGQLDFQLKKGVFAVTTLEGSVDGTPVKGSAQVNLSGKFPFQARVDVKKGKLQILEQLPKEIQLPVKLAGTITSAAAAKGTLQPLQWNVSGTVAASQVKVDRFTVEKSQFHFATDGKELQLTKLSGQLYDGKITGQATLPLEPKKAGSLALQIDNMKVGPLGRDVQFPFSLEGEIDGKLKASISAGKTLAQRKIAMSLNLQSPQLRLQGLPTDKITGTIQYKKDHLNYKITGKVLDGDLELNGQMPIQKKEKQPVGSGTLEVNNADLSKLWGQYFGKAGPSPLAGKASLQLKIKHDPGTYFPVGKGRLSLTNLQWFGNDLAQDIQTELVLTPRQLLVRDVDAAFAGGRLRGNAAINLEQLQKSRFTFNLDRVEAARLLGPLGKEISGPVSVRVVGTLGPVWYGYGALTMLHGKVFSMPVETARLPFRWRFYPATGRGQAHFVGGTAVVARGRASGRAKVVFGSTLNLDSKVKFSNVDLQTLLREMTSYSQLGAARISGEMSLAAHNMRSLSDLSGNLQATLGRNQGLQFPVLRQLSPFVGLPPSTSFNKGNLKATLSKGVVNVQKLSLQSNSLQIFANGRITMLGRLNLEVVARTGQIGPGIGPLSWFAGKIPAIGPIPVGLIVRVSRAVSNQSVYADVTGTLRNPIIRVRPLKTLSEDAVRFFVQEAVPTQ